MDFVKPKMVIKHDELSIDFEFFQNYINQDLRIFKEDNKIKEPII